MNSAEIASQALELLPDEAVALDGSGTIVLVNERWRRFAAQNGAPQEVMNGVGLDYLDVCQRAVGGDSPLAVEALQGIASILRGTSNEFLLEYPCHSVTSERWFLMHATGFPPLQGALITHVDITERKLMELATWESAHHDALTGVLNRRGIEVAAARILGPEQLQGTVQLVVVDIDGLKSINDRYGHLAGDAAIKATAKALMDDAWQVGRLGGDEFVSIQATRGMIDLFLYLRRIRARFSKERGDLPVNISIGHASAPVDGDSFEELMAVADARMYTQRLRTRHRTA